MTDRRRTVTIMLLVTAMAGGCALLVTLGFREERVAFSHANHAEKEELDCASCHAQAEKGDKAGMPKFRQCALCHEGIDENKPEERRLAALYPDGKPEWSAFTALVDDVIFSHKTHVVDGKIDCAECHRGIEGSTAVTEEVRVTMRDCTACHARHASAEAPSPTPLADAFRTLRTESPLISAAAPDAQDGPDGAEARPAGSEEDGKDEARRQRLASNDCSVCHKTIREDTPPDSHRRDWKRFHGQTVCADTGRTADRCAMCHTDASCSKCHQDEPPENHTAYWRHRGHGVAASVGRDRCAVCHTVDACDRCHRETSPINHTGAWGGVRQRHCLTCHVPLKSEGCFTCHKTNPGHATAPPRPANAQHAGATAASCLTCHQTIGLPHPDNGDSCAACH